MCIRDSGVERNFIFYNGAEATKSFKMNFKDLKADAQYRMTTIDSKGKLVAKTLKGSELMAGVAAQLASQDYVRVSVKCLDTEIVSDFVNMQDTQRALSAFYASLQEVGEDKNANQQAIQIAKAAYETALKQYQSKQYANALNTLASISVK